MAVGVPETEVFGAADAVLARGERPTVERVRLELGRGSPARVGSLLDQWWDHLAQRLRSETRLPAIPSEVSQAFVSIWQQAVDLAKDVAEQELTEQRQVVLAERASAVAIEDAARKEATQYRQQAAAAISQQQVVERRLADLERLLEQGQRQIDDLTQQRDVIQQERDVGRKRVQTLERQVLADRDEADQARNAQEVYVRGVEERAHREVDRSREDTKSALLQVKQLVKQTEVLQQRCENSSLRLGEAQQQSAAHQAHAKRESQLVHQTQAKLEVAQAKLQDAIQRAAAQQARADTFERQAALQQQVNENAQASRTTSHKPRKSKKLVLAEPSTPQRGMI